MITIYDKDATSFHTDGLGVLIDFVNEPEVTERHGYLECKFTYLLSGQNAEFVKQGYHVKMAPNDRQGALPFTIYEAEPDYVGEVIEVLGRVKIANDIRNRSIPYLKFENVPLNSVLDQIQHSMQSKIAYRQTNHLTINITAEFEEMNAYDALISHEQSILNRSGAELIFYEDGLSFHYIRGRRKVEVIRKESYVLKKMAIRYNQDELVTRIIPFTTLMNDSVVDGERGKERHTTEQKIYGTPVVSQNIKRYGLPEVTRYVEYRNEVVSKREVEIEKERKIELNNYKYQTSTDLDNFASRFFVDNVGIDFEKIVANLEMYGFYDTKLNNFGLYDTIEFYSEKYDVDVELRVSETVYQPRTKRMVRIVFEQNSLTFNRAKAHLDDGKISNVALSERIKNDNNQYNQRHQMIDFINKLDGTRLNFVSELPRIESSQEGDIAFWDKGDKGEIWEFKNGVWHRRLGDVDEEMKVRIAEIEKQSKELKESIGDIDDLRKKINNTSVEGKLATEIIGHDGKMKYSKNRLDLELTPNELLTFEEGVLRIKHNGLGFVPGHEYTISFTMVERERPHSRVDIQTTVNASVTLVPQVNNRYPTKTGATHDKVYHDTYLVTITYPNKAPIVLTKQLQSDWSIRIDLHDLEPYISQRIVGAKIETEITNDNAIYAYGHHGVIRDCVKIGG